MKALLVGGTGYVGQAICKELAKRFIPYQVISRRTVNYTDPSTLRASIRTIRPTFVINCAGVTGTPNVDWCDEHKTETLTANIVLPHTIAHVCDALEIPFAHISSGCIYNGPGPAGGWLECHEPNFRWTSNPPSSFYSGSKAFAEVCLKPFQRRYIWRIRMLFGAVTHPKNLITKLLNYPTIYDSPPNSLSNLEDAAFACVELWTEKAPYGTYNVVNPGSMTNRQVVGLIESILKPARKFDQWVEDYGFYRDRARVPRSNCILSTEKLMTNGGIQLRDVTDRMAECLERWRAAT